MKKLDMYSDDGMTDSAWITITNQVEIIRLQGWMSTKSSLLPKPSCPPANIIRRSSGDVVMLGGCGLAIIYGLAKGGRGLDFLDTKRLLFMRVHAWPLL